MQYSKMATALSLSNVFALPSLFGGRSLDVLRRARSFTFRPDAKFPRRGERNQIAVKDFNLSINGSQILKNVNLTIPDRKITCIIGPSGCGKSTLLKSMNRLNDSIEGVKMEGSIMLGSTSITNAEGMGISEIRRRVGLVPQRPCPLPMSIYENVAYGCRIHGIVGKRRLDRIVEFYLRAAGIWDEVKDRLREPAIGLSIGQQQRLCLARTLAVEPEYMLADEATSALDPISSRTIEDLFVKLKEKYSIIMVTHTLSQARRIADHVIFMYLGEVIEEGSADQVFNNPQKEMTRKYLDGAFS